METENSLMHLLHFSFLLFFITQFCFLSDWLFYVFVPRPKEKLCQFWAGLVLLFVYVHHRFVPSFSNGSYFLWCFVSALLVQNKERGLFSVPIYTLYMVSTGKSENKEAFVYWHSTRQWKCPVTWHHNFMWTTFSANLCYRHPGGPQWELLVVWLRNQPSVLWALAWVELLPGSFVLVFRTGLISLDFGWELGLD